ncbi:MAG TPA: flagellar biosynthetic protein FliO [Terriglobales bacterium]|nr:flagellar biosynthetic protein FliO [Terriglobales bacterium]
MDGENYLRFILALVLVLGLLALAAVLLRRTGLAPKLGRARRLSLIEALPLGPRHRLILVRRDNVEHLLLIGPQGDVVVETGIAGSALASTTSPAPGTSAARRSFDEMLERPDDAGPAADHPHTTSLNEPH